MSQLAQILSNPEDGDKPISIRTLRRWAEDGDIPASKRGTGRWYVDLEELKATFKELDARRPTVYEEPTEMNPERLMSDSEDNTEN